MLVFKGVGPSEEVAPESDKSESNLVALDVSVLRVHGGRVPRHVQLGGRGRLYGHILRWGSRHCWRPT